MPENKNTGFKRANSIFLDGFVGDITATGESNSSSPTEDSILVLFNFNYTGPNGATIEGIEGKDSALVFLKKNGFDLLFHFARSADSWKDSQIWLQKKDKLLYAISLKIEYVKDEIELRNQDPHKLNP